jgi:hypothetical protein
MHGRGGGGGGRHAHLDQPMCPKTCCKPRGLSTLLCVLLGAGDVVASMAAWMAVLRSDPSPPAGVAAPATLAYRDLQAWSWRCSIIDVALLGIVRGLFVLGALAYTACCAPSSSSSITVAGSRGGAAAASPRLPTSAWVALLVLLGVAGLSVAKTVAFVDTHSPPHATNHSICGTSTEADSWVAPGQQTGFVIASAVLGLTQLAAFLMQSLLRTRFQAAQATVMGASTQAAGWKFGGAADDERTPLLRHMHAKAQGGGGGGGKGGRGGDKPPTLWRLLGLIRQERPLIAVGMCMLVLSSCANLAVPAVAGSIVGAISSAQSRDGPAAAINSTGNRTGSSEAIEEINTTVTHFLVVVVLGSLSTACRNFIFSLCGCRLRDPSFGSPAGQNPELAEFSPFAR